MDLAQQLGLLLGNFEHLSPRIKHLDYKTDACGERIDVRCSYIAFRDGSPTFDEFIDVVATHIISFCLPRTEIRAALNLAKSGDHVRAARAMAELSERARSLFIKAKKGTGRSGEAGEIVLYLLTEWLLKAPQIVSKMYLKTNSQMPVYGMDGIHARYDGDTAKLHLYWGESKAHATLASALASALNSIDEFVTGAFEKREIEIVSSFADFDEMDDEAKKAFLSYLDPYSDQSNERVAFHSCLLVFNFTPELGDKAGHAEGEFVKAVNAEAAKFIEGIAKSVADKGLGSKRFEFFLLPVESVEEFRDEFQAKIGWPP